jgi:hypothetical protein
MPAQTEIDAGLELFDQILRETGVLKRREARSMADRRAFSVTIGSIQSEEKKVGIVLSHAFLSDLRNTADYQNSAKWYARGLAGRMANQHPMDFYCKSEVPIRVEIDWPFDRTQGSDGSFVHVSVYDLRRRLHSAIFAAIMTHQQFRFDLKKDPFLVEAVIVNTARRAVDEGKLTFQDQSSEPRRLPQLPLDVQLRDEEMGFPIDRFLGGKVFWMGFRQGDKRTKVWIADQEDADYLGTDTQTLIRTAQVLEVQKMLILDATQQYATAGERLLQESGSFEPVTVTSRSTKLPAISKFEEEKPLRIISKQLLSLDDVVRSVKSNDTDIHAATEELARWKAFTVELIGEYVNQAEAGRLHNKKPGALVIGQPRRNLLDEARLYRAFLVGLNKEMQNNPEKFKNPPDTKASATSGPGTRDIGFETALESYKRVGEPLGSGGTGVVYEVQDSDGNHYALKLLNSSIDKTRLKRFKNEISFCSTDRHKNIIRVLDHGLASGQGGQSPFYVMPLYSKTLRSLISAGIKPADVLFLFDQVLDGLEAAHLQGVCHRDLKPENILFDPLKRLIVVADFGIAKFNEEDLHTAVETSNRERLANFLYSAPEQRIRGKTVETKADIYALGLILNEMFTGDVPQGAGIKPIGAVAPDYSILDEVVEAMRQQIPERRPTSIQSIRDLLAARKVQ